MPTPESWRIHADAAMHGIRGVPRLQPDGTWRGATLCPACGSLVALDGPPNDSTDDDLRRMASSVLDILQADAGFTDWRQRSERVLFGVLWAVRHRSLHPEENR